MSAWYAGIALHHHAGCTVHDSMFVQYMCCCIAGGRRTVLFLYFVLSPHVRGARARLSRRLYGCRAHAPNPRSASMPRIIVFTSSTYRRRGMSARTCARACGCMCVGWRVCVSSHTTRRWHLRLGACCGPPARVRVVLQLARRVPSEGTQRIQGYSRHVPPTCRADRRSKCRTCRRTRCAHDGDVERLRSAPPRRAACSAAQRAAQRSVQCSAACSAAPRAVQRRVQCSAAQRSV